MDDGGRRGFLVLPAPAKYDTIGVSPGRVHPSHRIDPSMGTIITSPCPLQLEQAQPRSVRAGGGPALSRCVGCAGA